MPSLSIKNVPETVIERLRKRAERNHRSLQGELLALVSEAVMAPQAAGARAGRRDEPIRSGTRTLKQLCEERQARGMETRSDLPLAVDIIRADRDAR